MQVAYANETLYIRRPNGLEVVDLSSPESPKRLGFVFVRRPQERIPPAAGTTGRWLVMADTLIDVSGRGDPQLVGAFAASQPIPRARCRPSSETATTTPSLQTEFWRYWHLRSERHGPGAVSRPMPLDVPATAAQELCLRGRFCSSAGTCDRTAAPIIAPLPRTVLQWDDHLSTAAPGSGKTAEESIRADREGRF